VDGSIVVVHMNSSIVDSSYPSGIVVDGGVRGIIDLPFSRIDSV
jgi:hypothetical protein